MKLYSTPISTLRLDLKEFQPVGLPFEQIAEVVRSIKPCLRLDLKEFQPVGLTFEQIAEVVGSIEPHATWHERLTCRRVGPNIEVPLPKGASTYMVHQLIENALNELVAKMLPNWDDTIPGKVWAITAEQLVLSEPLTPEQQRMTFQELGADSLDSVELVMAVEDEFGVDLPDSEWENIKTPNQLALWLQSHIP